MLVISAAASAALLSPVRAGIRGGAPCMSAFGEGYWQSKSAMAKLKVEQELMALDEMEEREQMYLGHLRQEREKVNMLQEQISSLQQLCAAAEAKALVAAPSAPAISATSSDADKAEIASLKAELQAMREKVEEVEMKREVEVQKVAAFWLEKLSKAGEKAAGPPSPPPPPPPPAISTSDLDAKAQERIAALENEIDQLEEEFDTITDRLEVQAETIMLANTRLDEVGAALDAQALQAEEQLQRTAAFWIERNAQLKSKASQAEALRAALAAAELTRERDVQRTAAYWLDKLAAARATAGATPSGSSGNSAAAAPSAGAKAGVSDAALAKELEATQQALEAMTLQREVDVQKVSAFWLEKVNQLKAAKSAKNKKA